MDALLLITCESAAAYCLESEAEALLATYNEKKFDAKELEAWITSEVELKTQRLQVSKF